MREAVIVSYARTGSGQGWPRRLQHHSQRFPGRARHQARGRQIGRRGARGGRRLLPRQLRPWRLEPGAQRRASGGSSDHHLRRDHQPLLFLGLAIDRHGGALRDGRRRRVRGQPSGGSRIDQLAALRARCFGSRSIPSSPRCIHDIFMPMIDTADIVAKPLQDLAGISRTSTRWSLQRRMAAAQQAKAKFADEIVPMATKMKVVDKATKEEEHPRLRRHQG